MCLLPVCVGTIAQLARARHCELRSRLQEGEERLGVRLRAIPGARQGADQLRLGVEVRCLIEFDAQEFAYCTMRFGQSTGHVQGSAECRLRNPYLSREIYLPQPSGSHGLMNFLERNIDGHASIIAYLHA
jgi:hypothetical protein